MKWTITDHVCKKCLGRVLERTNNDGTTTARCADCGEMGSSAVHICACSMTLRTGTNAGFMCARNPHKSSRQPYEIAVRRVFRAPQVQARPLTQAYDYQQDDLFSHEN